MSNALRVAHGEFGRVALLDMDRHLVRHTHPHCHVLLKVEGADTHFSVRNELASLTDRSAVLVNAWEAHAYVHDPTRPRTVILALYIEPAWLRRFRPNWSASGAPGFFEQPVGDVTPRIQRLAHDLASEMVRSPDARASQEALLSHLMIAVIERFTPWRTLSVSIRGLAEQAIVDHRVRRALEVMRGSPGAITDMASLARTAGLSRAQFFRAFERSTRVAPRLYLNMLRFEIAVNATVTGRETFAAVSDRLGFAAPAHFSRFFRDHAGASPSEFRSVAGLTQAAA